MVWKFFSVIIFIFISKVGALYLLICCSYFSLRFRACLLAFLFIFYSNSVVLQIWVTQNLLVDTCSNMLYFNIYSCVVMRVLVTKSILKNAASSIYSTCCSSRPQFSVSLQQQKRESDNDIEWPLFSIADFLQISARIVLRVLQCHTALSWEKSYLFVFFIQSLFAQFRIAL